MLTIKSTHLLLLGGLGSFALTAVDASNGCCSLNYKTCINWCGKTKKSCGKCKHKDGVAWIDGPQQSCKKRWKGCANDPNSCCDGLVCREDKNSFKMCLPPKKGSDKEKKSPTKPPTSKPATGSPTDSKSTPSSNETGDLQSSSSDGNNKSCCTLDFVNCIDWCGPTKTSCLSCNHHDGVGWMPNGKPKDQCYGRWTGCENNRSACCDGLVCQPDANNFLMCLPSFLLESTPQTKSPTVSPSAKPSGSPSSTPTSNPSSKPSSSPSSPPSSSPSTTPSVSPSSEPSLSPTKAPSKPCCSLDFKNCIDWCGPSYDTCSNCNHHDGLGWLWKGAPKDDTCIGRWTGCGQNPDACCDGLVCKEDPNNYLMCLPKTIIGTKAPTPEPTQQPIATPTNKPTIAITKTDAPTTASPTTSMTTENPTAEGTESSSPEKEEEVQSGAPTDSVIVTDSPTEYPTFQGTESSSPEEEEEVQTGAPTDLIIATDSPTEYPTFHPTELTLEPTSADTTFEPTSSVTTFEPTVVSSTPSSCVDDPEFSFRDDITKGCDWVGKNSDNRCDRKWNGKNLKEYCPATCEMCPSVTNSFRRQLRGRK